MEKYINLENKLDYEELKIPAKIIKEGGIVIFPTETVYGIGTNGLNKEAIKKLPQREKDLNEAKFFQEKKLRELSEDFNISPSRISRIIQSGLIKIRKDLEENHII